MFDLAASPDIINCTGNSYMPMASRSMPTAKTFVEVHPNCDQRSHFTSDSLHAIDSTRSARAVDNHTTWCCASSTYPEQYEYGASAGSSTSVCTGPYSPVSSTTMAVSMTTSGHLSTWTQQRGASPAHVWRHDSAIPPRMHTSSASLRGGYGEFAGGVNIKEEYSDPSDYSSDTCSDLDWTSRSATANSASSSASGLADLRHVHGHVTDAVQSMVVRNRRSPHNKLRAEDEERRRIRRERNKLAAARCRQRRVDLTNQLLAETESLEDEKLQLEKEISNLQRQRHQLEFVLDSHTSRCRHVVGAGPARNHVTQLTTTAAAAPSVQSTSSRPFAVAAAAAAPVSMKVERAPVEDLSIRAGRGGTGAVGRPNSLSLSVPSCCGSGGGAGMTTTPMTFASLGLDCMVDGHTGLTPITGSPSCTAGGQRSHDDMSAALHPDGLSPTTLMTL